MPPTSIGSCSARCIDSAPATPSRSTSSTSGAEIDAAESNASDRRTRDADGPFVGVATRCLFGRDRGDPPVAEGIDFGSRNRKDRLPLLGAYASRMVHQNAARSAGQRVGGFVVARIGGPLIGELPERFLFEAE